MSTVTDLRAYAFSRGWDHAAIASPDQLNEFLLSAETFMGAKRAMSKWQRAMVLAAECAALPGPVREEREWFTAWRGTADASEALGVPYDATADNSEAEAAPDVTDPDLLAAYDERNAVMMRARF